MGRLRRTAGEALQQAGHGLKGLVGGLRWKSTPCLFILSTGRTGTLATIRLLNLSPRLRAFHEPPPYLGQEAIQVYRERTGQRPGAWPLFAKARRGGIGLAGWTGRVYAEYGPVGYLAPEIAQGLPASKFLHQYRHPGDFIRSAMRRGWFAGHPWDIYRIVPGPDHPDRQPWETSWTPFQKIAWYWSEVNRYILEMAEHIPADRFLSLPAEELLRVETGAYLKLFEFLDVPAPPESDARAVFEARLNAQTEGHFPAYADWDANMREEMLRIAGPVMARLGYPA